MQRLCIRIVTFAACYNEKARTHMHTDDIRHAVAADAPRLAEIYNHYIAHSTATFETVPLSAEEMAQRIADIAQSYPYFVSLCDGRIIGYAYAHPWNTRAACSGHSLETTVYVAPDMMHKGIGTALMNHLIGHCRHEGYHALIAIITDDNQQSIAMHRKLGFEPVGHYREVARKFGRWLGVAALELMI